MAAQAITALARRHQDPTRVVLEVGLSAHPAPPYRSAGT